MATTSVSDILIPSVWDPYFAELIAEKAYLYDSGIVIRDTKLDALAQKGGTSINMPFFTDLTGDDQILSDSSPLVPGKIETGQDIGRLHLRGDARSVNDLATALSGADPLKAIADKVWAFWQKKEQALLIASLTGIFADNEANDGGDLIHVHGAEALASNKPWNDTSPTVMCPSAIIQGQGLLGDAQNRFTAIAMHSKCYQDLLHQELIDFERPSDAPAKIPYYLEKRVIVDDTCPTRSGTTDGTLYQSYLFAEGAVGRGEGAAEVPSETTREALAGNTILITRRHFLLHPRGIKFTSGSVAAEAPTNAECEAAGNWDRVYEKKNLRIAMIETN